jgi:hypothetical protein
MFRSYQSYQLSRKDPNRARRTGDPLLGAALDWAAERAAAKGWAGVTVACESITGLSPVGAAAILAEIGDPRRFATARALVKHADLAQREKLSGAFTGAGPGSPARGAQGCAWRPGGRSGEPSASTLSTAPATST